MIFQDEWLLVVDKPSGVLVHRGWGDDELTAADVVREIAGTKVHAVHRLDRGTSGVLMFARDAQAAAAMGGLIEKGEIEKRYVALVRGVIGERGNVDSPLPRREGGPKVEAFTEYERMAIGEHRSLVLARPRTGRPHQIRRHLKHTGHPVIGDSNYGKGALNREYRERFGLGRLALHAARYSLIHPVTHCRLELAAPLPQDLSRPLRAMGFSDSDFSADRVAAGFGIICVMEGG